MRRAYARQKINCFYVHLVAAIPAGQHFGFGGRLSRRTDLRLYTFSCFYFSYSSYLFIIVFIFSYCYLLLLLVFLFTSYEDCVAIVFILFYLI